jgi:hypothetical protein
MKRPQYKKRRSQKRWDKKARIKQSYTDILNQIDAIWTNKHLAIKIGSEGGSVDGMPTCKEVTDAILSEFNPEIQEYIKEMSSRTGIRVEGTPDRLNATMRVFPTEEEARERARDNIEPDMEVDK